MAPKKTEKTTTTKGASSEEGADVPAISAGDLKLILSVLRNSAPTAKPWLAGTVNWDSVVEELQFKGPKTAKDRTYQVCKKNGFFEATVATGDPSSATSTSRNTSTPKKAAATKGKGKGKRAAPAEDDEGEESEAPFKKTKMEETPATGAA
ncbi:hypothetical protein DL766_003493 [Monosporascus sp. MC13-8B]|uniref:Uncharacterized protein n=1 Tax=Monosporascus cannonballus TaxID=155416 RepID=A0ABY0HNR1_9PEZI|nr:hypothetical protein DL763_005363 [Monosporascus cannonballus]RYO95470.1 hypothetical protein DL762_000032 [Monosporascus cannonballus]RYP33331.1 hypothetical protein DL766_003493 [Monosporascus sp. MC13-8B]